MHPLLARQLKRLGLQETSLPSSPQVWGELLARIGQSYLEADQGHALLERSLALSSKEMQDLYLQLKHGSETQLAQERNKLQTVLQSLGEGLCVVDQAWNIQMANRQAERLLGVAAHDLVGRPVDHLISPGPGEYRDGCLISDTPFRSLPPGEPYQTDNGLLITADGRNVPIALVVTPMQAHKEMSGNVLVFRDISRQKQIEWERQDTEDLLRRIQTGLTDLAKSPDISNGHLDQAFQTITRVAADVLYVERVSIWFFAADHSAIECAKLHESTTQVYSQGFVLAASAYPSYFRALKTEQIIAADDVQRDPRTTEFTEDYLIPHGITSMLDVPIRSGGRMVGIICHEHVGPIRRWTLEEQHFAVSIANTVELALEAADGQKVEQALRTSEWRLNTAVRNTHVGIWEWDYSFKEVYLSPEWKRQLGYGDDEIPNRFEEWESRLHPDDHDRAVDTIKAYLALQDAQFELEHRLRHKDGSYRWILSRGGILKHDGESSTRLVGIHIDVTDRKLAEEALHQAKETAEAASQAKSQFLANMSHEIRTPMNGVLGMAELLLRRSLGDKERYLAESIYQSGTVLLTVINDILDFSKIEAGKLHLEMIPFEIRRTIKEAIDLAGPGAQKKQLTVLCRIDPTIPQYVFGDPTRFTQILVNLVGNAVKFTEHGVVEISATLEGQQGPSSLVGVTVRDTGIGMSPEVQARLFTAFSQADGSMSRKYGGTGLGLAIVKQLVTLMGGRIEFQSSPGQGSNFRFVVPLKECADGTVLPVPTPVHAGEMTSHPSPPTDSDRVCILLVEDAPVNREVACGMLETLTYHVDTVENGREAVEAAAKKAYALILMDCQMPVMDGFTATKLIREHETQEASCTDPTRPQPLRRIPIVALTAHAMQGDREMCVAAGMDDYLTKPFTLSQLQNMVAKWVAPKPNVQAEPSAASSRVGSQSLGGDEQDMVSRVHTSDRKGVAPMILDQSALAAIRALQRPGYPDIFGRILSRYMESSQEVVETIRLAVQSNDAAALHAAAHRLKSSSAQLGASVLAEDCRELEMMGACRELGQARNVLSELEQHYAETCAAFREELLKWRPAA